MAFHPAEIDHSVGSGQPLAGNHLADVSLSDFNTARTAMASSVIPGAFGTVAIDFESDQSRSEVKMAAEQDPPPSVSGPGCKFIVWEGPRGTPEVKVTPPKSGQSCVVEFPPDDQPVPKMDY